MIACDLYPAMIIQLAYIHTLCTIIRNIIIIIIASFPGRFRMDGGNRNLAEMRLIEMLARHCLDFDLSLII